MGQHSLFNLGISGPPAPAITTDEMVPQGQYKGHGSPIDANIPARIGQSYLDVDTGDVWNKVSGDLMPSGWEISDSGIATVNVTSSPFNAVGDGVTDDTAAIQAAYDSLSSTNGGELFFPVGTWKFNLIVTKPNVTIRSVSHVHDNSGGGTNTNHFRPAILGSPVIQIGNNTGVVRGFKMQDVTVDGRDTGAIGVYFAGGAFEARFQNAAVTRFATCVKIQGGSAYPASLIFLDNVDGQPSNVSGARGILVSQTANYPASYTTAVFINGVHWDGPASNGYAVEIDSCEVVMTNSYFDLSNNHGFKISKSQASNPKLYLSGVSLDSGNNLDVLIETHNNQRIFGDIVIGSHYSIDGKWKLLDGTLLTPPPGSLQQNIALSYPNVTGSLNLVTSGEADYTGGSYTNHRLYADGSGIHAESIYSIRLEPATGIVQLNSAASGASFLKFQDNFANKSALLTGFAGNLYIAPEDGAYAQVTSALGTAWFQIAGTDGATFLKGAGLNATTIPYLDANKQIKSSVVTPTELGYLAGASSALQTQISAKAPIANPAFTGVIDFPIAGNSGTMKFRPGTSFIELQSFTGTASGGINFLDVLNNKTAQFRFNAGFLDIAPTNGSYARIQKFDASQTWFQIGGTTGDTFFLGASLNVSTVPYLDASRQFKSSTVTPTELGYLSGVTSAIQTQLASKLSSSSTTLTPITKAARNALTPSNGMFVYQSDNTEGFRFYQGGAWVTLGGVPDP